MEKQTVLILETVLISIWLWKCPSYSTYIRDVFEKIETVPILETVLILEMKEYLRYLLGTYVIKITATAYTQYVL